MNGYNKKIEEYYIVLKNIEHKILPKAVKLFCDGKLKVVNERVEII